MKRRWLYVYLPYINICIYSVDMYIYIYGHPPHDLPRSILYGNYHISPRSFCTINAVSWGAISIPPPRSPPTLKKGADPRYSIKIFLEVDVVVFFLVGDDPPQTKDVSEKKSFFWGESKTEKCTFGWIC